MMSRGFVKLVEAAARDGLQAVPMVSPVPTDAKLSLVRRCFAAGLRHFDAASFASPKLVPQLADGAALLAMLVQTRKSKSLFFHDMNRQKEVKRLARCTYHAWFRIAELLTGF